MSCFMCKGTLEDGFSTFTAVMENRIVIIKHVPSNICQQCGEASYSDETAQRLEQIVNSLETSINTEIAVLSYTKQAA